jgi:hypothetical protein
VLLIEKQHVGGGRVCGAPLAAGRWSPTFYRDINCKPLVEKLRKGEFTLVAPRFKELDVEGGGWNWMQSSSRRKRPATRSSSVALQRAGQYVLAEAARQFAAQHLQTVDALVDIGQLAFQRCAQLRRGDFGVGRASAAGRLRSRRA